MFTRHFQNEDNCKENTGGWQDLDKMLKQSRKKEAETVTGCRLFGDRNQIDNRYNNRHKQSIDRIDNNKLSISNILSTKLFLIMSLMVIISISVFISHSPIAAAYEPDVSIQLSTDSDSYYPGDTIDFSIYTYINNILVLSVPAKLEVTDPFDNVHQVQLTGYTNGEYKGKFSSHVKGEYTAKAVVNINDEETIETIKFSMTTPDINIEVSVPEVIEYEFGPVEINGNLTIMDNGKNLNQRIQLFVASSSSPFYTNLCDVLCYGRCTFSCRLEQNIELAEYKILAKTEYNNIEQVAKDDFRIIVPETENLNLSLSHKKLYLSNETLIINLNASLNKKPLRDALVNIRLLGPDGKTINLISEEILPGIYSSVYIGEKLGDYSMQAVLSKGNIFGNTESSFTIVEKPVLIQPAEPERAIDIGTGRVWLLSELIKSGDSKIRADMKIDFSRLLQDYNINTSEVYLISNHKRKKLNITESNIPLPEFVLNHTGQDSMLFIEAQEIGQQQEIGQKQFNVSNASDNSLNKIIISTIDPGHFLIKIDEELVSAQLDKVSAQLKNNESINDGSIKTGKRRMHIDFSSELDEVEDVDIVFKVGKGEAGYWGSDDGELVIYGHEDEYEIYTTSINNMIRIKDVEISSSRILKGKTLYISPVIEGIEHNPTVILRIYNPLHQEIVMKMLDESHSYAMDSATMPGKHTYFISAFDASDNISYESDNSWDFYKGSFEVLSREPAVSIHGNYTEKTLRNSELFYKHLIRNDNYGSEDTIEIMYESNISTILLYEADGKTLLRDTNRNGIKDTGILAPGESREIIIKVIIPPNVAIGSTDDLTIIVMSSKDQNVTASVIDRTTVVAFREYTRPDFLNDLEIVSLDEVDNNIIVKVKNNDIKQRIATVLVEINTSLGKESKLHTKLLEPDTEDVFVHRMKNTEVSHLVRAILVDENEKSLSDDNTLNNYKILAVDNKWHVSWLNTRIPIQLKETHSAEHADFYVKLFVDFGRDADIDNMIPVLFDGNDYITGNYRLVSFDEMANSGLVILHFKNIRANSKYTAYMYYDSEINDSIVGSTVGDIDNEFIKDYKNRKFDTDLILNNNQVRVIGRWVKDRQVRGHYGSDYLHDLNMEKGWKTIIYQPKLELDSYELYAYYPSHPSFASSVPVLINTPEGTEYIELNQQIGGGQWNYIGAYDLDKDSYITVGNFGTDSIVAADAFLFRKVSFYSVAGVREMLMNGTIISLDKGAVEQREKDEKEDKQIGQFNFSLSSVKNTPVVVNLSEYLNELTYISYNSTKGFSVEFNESLAIIIPPKNYTGIAAVEFNNNIIILHFDLLILAEELSSNISTNLSINISANWTINLTINTTDISTNISANQTDNISIDENLLNITSNQTTSSFAENLTSFSENMTSIPEEAKTVIQGKAEINKPVSWIVNINNTALDALNRNKINKIISINTDADNIMVMDEKENLINVNFSVSNKTITSDEFKGLKQKIMLKHNVSRLTAQKEDAGFIRKVGIYMQETKLKNKQDKLEKTLPDVQLGNVTDIIIPDVVLKSADGIKIMYETGAPKISESEKKTVNFVSKKEIKVYSNVSVHYHNVTTEIEIDKARPEQIKLFWKVNNSRINIIKDKRFNLEMIDIDGDGYIEKLRWLTPRLSEQEFELEIDLTILNIQSYPTLYRNWTVKFNTTGTANLTITATNDTSWTEFLADGAGTSDDLNYLALYCGADELNNDDLYVILDDDSKIKYSSIQADDSYRVRSLFYPDWNCNETAHLENQIITTGRHILRFEFGNDVLYARNMGFLLYETFDSYANNSKAADFVDYNRTGVSSYAASDAFSVYKNSSNASFYRINTTDANNYYSEYNGTNAFSGAWHDYEVRTKLRRISDQGSWGIGIILYSQFSDGDANYYYFYLRSREGVDSGHFRLDSEDEGGHVYDGGDDESTVSSEIDKWYNIRAQVRNEAGPQARILAKIWLVNDTEPTGWEINDTHSLDGGSGLLLNGSAGFFVKDTTADFDYLIIENISSEPAITIHSPNVSTYAIDEMVWFNISIDKVGKNCSYVVDGSTNNMTKVNDTFFYANQSFGSYGVRTVWFYCDDNHGNQGNNSVTFNVGSGRVTISSPPNQTITDYTPLLNAVFNSSYDTWYQIDSGANSSQYPSTTNLTLDIGPLTEGPHTVVVFVNDTGFIDNASVSFAVDVPTPTSSLVIDYGDPTYTPDAIVDLGVYGDYIHQYNFSCNKTAWSGWIDSSGSNPDWYNNFNITNTSLGCNSSLGNKTVYVVTRNYFNETSSIVNDSIIWDPDTLAGSSFTDYFRNSTWINASGNLTINATTTGGLRLVSGCMNYSNEPGCWLYRTHIAVTEDRGNDNDNGLQINLTLNTMDLINNSKMRDNCSDIRVAWLNQSSGDLEEVYFWVDKEICNTTMTNIWTKLPKLDAYTTEHLYFYYGNLNANWSDKINGSNVFKLFDHFDGAALDTNMWTHQENAYAFANSEFDGTNENTREYIRSLNYQVGTKSYTVFKMRTDLANPNDWDGGIMIGNLKFLDDRDGQQVLTIDPGAWWGDQVEDDENRQDKLLHHVYGAVIDGTKTDFYDYTQGRHNTYGGVDSGYVWIVNDGEAGGGRGNTIIDWIYSVDYLTPPASLTVEEEANFNMTGYVVSDVIRPAGIETWEYLKVNHAIPDETNISYSVLDQNDNILCELTGAYPISYYDISGCVYGYDRIKVRADITTTNEFISPILYYWTISWIIDSDVVIDEPDDIYQTRYVNLFANGSVYSDIDNCSMEAYLQYKLSAQTNEFVEDSYADFITYTNYNDISINNFLKLKANLSSGNLLDSGWNERFMMNVSLNETRYNYPVKIVINTTDIDFSKTDFTDLAFTYYNSSAGVELNMSHWVQLLNSSIAIIWVKVPEITTSNLSIYMYYDNENTQDASNGDDVFEFFDHFEGSTTDSAKWTDIDGSYSVSNSELHGTRGGNVEHVYTHNFNVSNQTIIEVRMKGDGGGDWDSGIGVGLTAGADINFVDDSANAPQAMGIDPERWWGAYTSGGVLRQNVNEYHNYRAVMDGTDSHWYDDTQGRSHTYANEVRSGPVLMVNDGDGGQGVIYDWIFVRPYGADANVSKLGSNKSYMPEGNYTSNSLDTEFTTLSFGKITWTETVPANTQMKVYTRSSDDDSYWTDWEEQTNGGTITTEGKRYIEYLVWMNITNISLSTSATPKFDNLKIEYSASSPDFIDMTTTDTKFAKANPYSCGNLDSGDHCYPQWNNVEPKMRGMFKLRIHANSTTCSYDKTSNEKIIYVFADTSINGFDSDEDPAARNQTIVLSGTLQDADLTDPLASKTIKIYDGTTYLGSATTNAAGVFSYSYQIPSNATLGTHTFKAVFEKDYTYYYNPTSATTNVKVSSNPVIHNITISPNPAGNGQTVVINSSVTDEVGLAAGGVYARIRLPNGTTESYVMTDDGNGNYTLSFTDTWLVGSYLVTIVANNTDGISSQSVTNFQVQIEATTLVSADKLSYQNYENVYLTNPYTWWNSSWPYRQEMTVSVSSGSTPAGYQVHVYFNSTDIGSNFNWSYLCNDTRFVMSNGTELPYWVEYCNSSGNNASIWVMMGDSITTSLSTIFMYYGNENAVNRSNGTATFDWFDDFRGAHTIGDYTIDDQGSTNAPSAWSIQTANGYMNQGSNIYNGPYGTVALTGLNLDNYEIRYRSYENDDDPIGVLFSYQNANQWYGYHYTETYGGGGAAGTWRWLGKDNDDVDTFLGRDANPPGRFTIVNMTIRKFNDNITILQNGVQIFSVTDSDYDEGDIGIFTDADTNGRFYGPFIVRKYSNPEPTFTFVSESTSSFKNTGTTSIKGYRWAIVQRLTGSSWQDINPAIINDYAFSALKTIQAGGSLDVMTDWNANPWNTTTEPPGLYRAKIALVKNVSTPQSESAVLVDSNGVRVEAFYNFTIVNSTLSLTNLTHENLYDYTLNEYETTDSIDWINITVTAANNTALDANVTLALLDDMGLDCVGFGPCGKLKNYGEIAFNTSKTKTWDNSSNGYFIPEDVISGTYSLNWNVSMSLTNGPAYLNDTEYVTIHDMPSNFTTNTLERLYINEFVLYNLTIGNLWSQNLTNATVTINCPNIAGLVCNCSLAGQNGTICNLGNITTLTQETGPFNISAGSTAPTGDYNVNFTINYTNPAGDNKSWYQVKNAILEIRDRGILEIVDYYHNSTVIRGENAYFRVFANNTNGTAAANNVWLNYTVIPFNWTNITGSLYANATVLNPGEILWNNVTFLVGTDAGLGSQTILLNSSSPDVKPDFKSLFITVYANTSFSSYYTNDTNTSRGETVQLTAVLLWDNGTALVGETVYFYDETDSTLIGSGVTNGAGAATQTYSIDGTVSLGLHTLNVTYKGKGAIYTQASNRTTILDVGLKPVINTISDSPDPVGYGYNVTITANITDDDQIDTAIVFITYPNSSQINITMNQTSTDIYEANFTDTWFNGTYSYYVWTNDTTGSTDISATNTFDLEISALFQLQTLYSSYGQFENVTIIDPYEWWNTSWKKRRFITVQTIENMTNLTMELNLTSSNFNFSGTDGTDLRFIWVNGSEYVQVDHYVESWNSGAKTARVWIKIPQFENNTILQLYYNNTNAEDISNISKAWLWYDNFSVDISAQYTEVELYNRNAGGGYTWDVANSRLVTTGNNDDWTTFPTGVSASNLYLEAEGITGDDDAYGVMIRSGATYYEALVTSNHPGGAGETDGIYSDTVADTDPVLQRSTTTDYESNVIHKVAMAYNGTALRMWVDDVHECDYTVSITPDAFGPVHIANQPTASSYQFKARKYTDYPINITISEEEGSLILDRAATPFRGHLQIKVQRDNAGSWQDVTTLVDDYTSSKYRTIPSGLFLNLSEVWNPSPWNTGNSIDGTYRIYSYMLTPYGEQLNSVEGLVEAHYNFTIQPPAVNVTIDLIRIYEVNSTNRYGVASLYDSGLNKTFTLFINKSYRIEIETKNNLGSADWNLSRVNVNHTGLNESWYMSQTADIWYKIGAGSSQNNGSWLGGNVTWNTSDIGGVAAEDTKVTFYYAFNLTDNTTDDYAVVFKVVDPSFTKTDNSEFHVVVESANPPKLYNDIYNMTKTEVIRLFNSTTIYGRWASEIADADVYYNATIPGIISDDITLPVPNPYNWTNYTFSPTATWLLGSHVAQIRAKNPSDVWNNTLQYLNFSVYGLAYVKNLTINESTPGIGDQITIMCGIEDDSNDAAISGHNIMVYSNNALINWSQSNSSGQMQFNYTPPTYGIYSIICNITEQGWYKTDSRFQQSDTIFVKEFDPPRFFDVSGPALAHKGDTVTVSTRWTDNAGLAYAILATNVSGVMVNVSNMTLGGTNNWSNFSYTIPVSFTPGTLGWQQHANDTSDNYNTTSPAQTIAVWGWASVSSADVTPGSVMEGNYTNATCRVIDSNSSQGISGYNVSFYRGSTFIGWNLTNATGYTRHHFNDSGLGLHTIICNITDQVNISYNASTQNSGNDTLFVTNTPDINPPYALTYGINNSDLTRGDCLMVYGQWNEQINYSKAQYNMTIPIIDSYVATPYTNNWTNKSICTNNSWTVGPHKIKLWANDSVGNINDTAQYLDFNMTGRSRVRYMSPTGNLTKGSIDIICNVTDYDTNGSIEGYTVLFYSTEKGFVGSDQTNSSGIAVKTIDMTTYNTGAEQFQCQIASTTWYSASVTIDSEIVYLWGVLNVTINNPVNNSRLYRGQLYFLNSTTRDDNDSIVDPDNATWVLSDGTVLANNTDANWTIPTNYTLGNESINVTVNKTYNLPSNQSISVEIWAWAQLNQSILNPSDVGVDEYTTMKCQIIDYNTSEPLEGVNVTFHNATESTPPGLGSNLTNASGWATFTFSYNHTAYENVSCIIYDQQYVNVTNVTWLNKTINVTIVGVDMAVASIDAPLNNSCTHNHYVDIQVNISDEGVDIDNVNVTLLIDDVYNESNLYNFTAGESLIVNYTKWFNQRKRYNLTVRVIAALDFDPSNDNKTIYFDKYFTNLSIFTVIDPYSENMYNITIYTINRNNCSNENVSVYSFVPNNMNLTFNSTGYNTSYVVAGEFSGTTYVWWQNHSAYYNGSYYYYLLGSDDYHVSEAYVVGLDPYLE